MKQYLILAKDEPAGISDEARQEREAILNYAPKCPIYGPFNDGYYAFKLVPVMAKDTPFLFNYELPNKIDLSSRSLTNVELLAIHDDMTQQPPSGNVLLLSNDQGRVLYNARYKPTNIPV